MRPTNQPGATMRREFFLILTLAVALGAMASPAWADPTAQQALDYWNSQDSNKHFMYGAYLSGMAAGYGWMNAELQSAKRPMVYCQPEKLALSAEIVAQLLSGYLKRHPEFKQSSIGLVTLNALKDAFPCK